MNNAAKLTGSEKQVAWAKKIRSEKIAMLNDLAARFRAVPGYSIHVGAVEAAVSRLLEIQSAKTWIDNRSDMDALTGAKIDGFDAAWNAASDHAIRTAAV